MDDVAALESSRPLRHPLLPTAGFLFGGYRNEKGIKRVFLYFIDSRNSYAAVNFPRVKGQLLIQFSICGLGSVCS